jgi:hypothetical protein
VSDKRDIATYRSEIAKRVELEAQIQTAIEALWEEGFCPSRVSPCPMLEDVSLEVARKTCLTCLREWLEKAMTISMST